MSVRLDLAVKDKNLTCKVQVLFCKESWTYNCNRW